jgi:hypothetical protein
MPFLIQVRFLDAQLLEHGMEGSRLEFVLQIRNNRFPIPQVDGAVAALAPLCHELATLIMEPGIATQPAEELGSLHAQILGQYCPEVKHRKSMTDAHSMRIRLFI